jgi:hypothetical protein
MEAAAGEPLAAAGGPRNYRHLRDPEALRGGEPVGLATGFFTLTKTDLVLPGRLPLVLTRHYRSDDTSPGAFGTGGRHGYDVFLVAPTPSATGQLVLIRPDLTRYPFARQPDGTYRNTSKGT